MTLTRYRLARYMSDEGDAGANLEPHVDGQWYKADEVRAVLNEIQPFIQLVASDGIPGPGMIERAEQLLLQLQEVAP